MISIRDSFESNNSEQSMVEKNLTYIRMIERGEIIPRVWTRVRVRVGLRVEDRVRLRVRGRVGFRVKDRVRLRS